MKNKLMLTLLGLMVSLSLLSQYKPDTIIVTESYTSYVNKQLEQCLYVKYKLYKGGGDCKRPNNWVNDTKLKLVNENQYKGTIYDKGHLANAEDFAYNCHLDSLTFRDYNRIPQTKKLNRGVWKSLEDEVRGLSQNDSLLIICGGFWDERSKEVNGMKIPVKCWKLIYSLSQKKILYCYIFLNSDTPLRYESNIGGLELMLGYSLNIPKENVNNKKVKKKK
jgi:DNA/RNA endonuclease G (NUC1)